MKKKYCLLSLIALVTLTACQNIAVDQVLEKPNFENVSVHDPSIIKADDSYYIVGSHAMFAKSSDLIQWEQLASSINTDIMFEDVREELAEDFKYAKTNTTWASDLVQLKDGKYYLYYCLCEGSSPLSALGVAVSDSVEGPYKKVKTFLHSGTSPQFGKTYDARVHPNAIDPDVFYDKDGKLWMVYGSYSGGIFILEMNEKTGLPKEGDTYGKHLLGGNHARIEAPYIQYNPETDYYYLFTSFGGLTADSGYNLRVARSKNPDGPYEDIAGNQMDAVKGKAGTTFDDLSIQNYGNKLIGNFLYGPDDGLTNAGYVSPGHNSTYFDEKSGEYFAIFHTRFPNSGEMHEVRVHQLLFTESGWPIMVPLRYDEETIANYKKNQIGLKFKVILFEKEISDDISEPQMIHLKSNGKIQGELKGSWQLSDENSSKDSTVTINNTTYKGKFISAWDEHQEKQVMTFTGVSDNGLPIYLIEVRE